MENKLGLAERRALKEYQDNYYPSIEEAIKKAAHFDVEIDVKWEEIAKPEQGPVYKEDEYWGTTIFKPLTMALEGITIDAMGIDALKSNLNRIVIMHNPETAPASNYPNGLTFEDGVLSINFTPYSNADEYAMAERVIAIKQLLERNI